MTPLHPDEVPISIGLVRALIDEQHPRFSGLPLRASSAQGTDNVVFRLGAGPGAHLSVRLPRKAGAEPAVKVERDWLAPIASALPLPVPEPVAAGEPGPGYPFCWLVCRWVPGQPFAPDDPVGLDDVDAAALAGFVVALQHQPVDGAPQVPPGARAGPMAGYADRGEQALDALAAAMAVGRLPEDELDLDQARAVWRDAVAAPAWDRPGVWVHRDLMATNLLTDRGRLSGVIDFGGLSVGDPAGNLMTVFHVLSGPRRQRFAALVGADDASWARARGWALIQGVEALPYYLDTHPAMVAMARRVISSCLDPDANRAAGVGT